MLLRVATKHAERDASAADVDVVLNRAGVEEGAFAKLLELDVSGGRMVHGAWCKGTLGSGG